MRLTLPAPVERAVASGQQWLVRRVTVIIGCLGQRNATRYWPTRFSIGPGQLEAAKSTQSGTALPRMPVQPLSRAFIGLLASRASRPGYEVSCHWLRRCAALPSLQWLRAFQGSAMYSESVGDYPSDRPSLTQLDAP